MLGQETRYVAVQHMGPCCAPAVRIEQLEQGHGLVGVVRVARALLGRVCQVGGRAAVRVRAQQLPARDLPISAEGSSCSPLFVKFPCPQCH